MSTPLTAIAIQVSPQDNCAVAKVEIEAGTDVQTDSGVLSVSGAVTPGNRIGLVDIPAGEVVLQYGQPIGTSLGIAAGDPINAENLSNEVPVVRELPEDLATPAPNYLPESEVQRFAGFRRPDGRVGTRNWVAVIPTSMCASHEANQVAMRAEMTLWSPEEYPTVDGVVPLPHNKGCGTPDGDNPDTVMRALAAYADHPNVAAVLFLELGCEKTNASLMRDYLAARGGLSWDKPVAWVGVQEEGGTQGAIRRGLKEVAAMLPLAAEAQRTDEPISELILGVECGGSDAFSGISANPALGYASDLLVRSRGTVILSEVPEFCGAEHLLAWRARDAAVGREVYALVDWYKEHAAAVGAELGMNPSPGNIEGGLLNIAIKSLGAIAKGGTTRVEGTIDYATRPSVRGLNLMQGPGYDQESVPGLVAAGATAVVFTTGRGTTIGNAIAPVLKLTSNSAIYERMSSDLDLDAGGILDGRETIEQVGARVFERLAEVASGRMLACAEQNLHREFQIWAPDPVSL